MRTPRLIHPVWVKVHQINKAATRYDTDGREVVQNTEYKAVVTMPGQVSWSEQYSERKSALGFEEGESASVTFRKKDLTDYGVTLSRGDRYEQFGGQDADLYATRITPLAHYAHGPTLYRVMLSDRAPSRQTRG